MAILLCICVSCVAAAAAEDDYDDFCGGMIDD
jgi:hypothetical protein